MAKIKFYAPYIAAMIIVSIILGLIYATVQQSYRSGANDPQLQIAKDINEHIRKNLPFQKFMTDSIDLEKSLSVFVSLYNAKAELISSSGLLDGKFPTLPVGVFDFAKSNGENVITWQPKRAVRLATVILYTHSPVAAYIVVGRSLQEIEAREYNLRMMVFVGWLICIAIIGVAMIIQLVFRSK